MKTNLFEINKPIINKTNTFIKRVYNRYFRNYLIKRHLSRAMQLAKEWKPSCLCCLLHWMQTAIAPSVNIAVRTVALLQKILREGVLVICRRSKQEIKLPSRARLATDINMQLYIIVWSSRHNTSMR